MITKRAVLIPVVCLILFGCNQATPNQPTSSLDSGADTITDTNSKATDLSKKAAAQTLNAPVVLGMIANTVRFTEQPGEMMLRREANDLGFNEQGQGFVHRDQRENYDFEGNLDKITRAMKNAGFDAEVSQPQGNKVFKHAKYSSSSVTCYGEWRNITSAGTDELAFGCK